MQEQRPKSMSLSDYGNLLHLICQVWATSITIPIRSQSGRESAGVPGALVLLWIPLYVAFTHAGGILWLLPVYLVSQFFHRVGQTIRERKGIIEHSHYNGWPWLAMKFGAKDERRAKLGIEPVLSFLFGVALLPLGQYVGFYFMGGAAAMIVVGAIIEQRDRQRLRDMHNGMIEGGMLKGQSLRRERRFGHGATAG